VEEYRFKRVDKFKYLGSIRTQDNDIKTKISMRLQSANNFFCGQGQFFRSKTISKNLNIRMYLTLLRPITLYSAEKWPLKNKGWQCLREKYSGKFMGRTLMLRQMNRGNYTTTNCNPFSSDQIHWKRLKKKVGLGRTCLKKAWFADKKSSWGKPSREETSWETIIKMGRLR